MFSSIDFPGLVAMAGTWAHPIMPYFILACAVFGGARLILFFVSAAGKAGGRGEKYNASEGKGVK